MSQNEKAGGLRETELLIGAGGSSVVSLPFLAEILALPKVWKLGLAKWAALKGKAENALDRPQNACLATRIKVSHQEKEGCRSTWDLGPGLKTQPAALISVGEPCPRSPVRLRGTQGSPGGT